MNSTQLIEHPWFRSFPLIAILRGVTPEEVIDVAGVLIKNGFRFIEVPLNSPDALSSIRKLVTAYSEKAIIGAGTVTNIDKLMSVIETGARLIITPNMNPEVIKKAREYDCTIFSGIQTPTEALTAVDCGVSALKLFPADLIQPKGLKAIKSVLPDEVICCPTGGINADVDLFQSYIDAGASGFGLGSGLYSKGMSVSDVDKVAKLYRNTWLSVKNKK